VRILVDQSGYELLNLGDVAMLQSCVTRLRQLWPEAEILAISHAPERMAGYCPGTLGIGLAVADLPPVRLLPRKTRLALEQAWRITGPYVSGRRHAGRPRTAVPRTPIQAVQAADLVVASGGGYVTDSWWYHAAGVLGVLSLAQRLGKPTAMFGQGIGPIRGRTLRRHASGVLPGLAVLGLREGRIGREVALSLGTPPGAIKITGDDAMELVGGTSAPPGEALGLSMRVSGYAGVDAAAAAAVAEPVLGAARALQAPVVALPVSRYAGDGDLSAIRALFGAGGSRAEIVLSDLATPAELVAAAAGCRAIVTGSYHAAVFGLAQGVPAVCLTRSSYYDAKFAGLAELFPTACFVVSLAEPELARRLRTAIDTAWHLPAEDRDAARQAAVQQRDAGREAYAQFQRTVEDGSFHRRK